jgi:hypothetical protein
MEDTDAQSLFAVRLTMKIVQLQKLILLRKASTKRDLSSNW